MYPHKISLRPCLYVQYMCNGHFTNTDVKNISPFWGQAPTTTHSVFCMNEIWASYCAVELFLTRGRREDLGVNEGMKLHGECFWVATLNNNAETISSPGRSKPVSTYSSGVTGSSRPVICSVR